MKTLQTSSCKGGLGSHCRESDLFESDELQNLSPNGLKPHEILASQGVFFLKDIKDPLGIDSNLVIKEAKKAISQKKNPWETIGVKTIWNCWIVRMTRFKYRAQDFALLSQIQPNWDANIMLSQAGLFRLTDVCRLLPVNSHQLPYRAKKAMDPKKELGIWKDPIRQTYLVDMARFGPIFIGIWKGME